MYGTAARRRNLSFGRPSARPARREGPEEYYPDQPRSGEAEAQAYGPEAYERAAEMSYERTKRIQQESPYIHEEVVEHKVHDLRLYIGMWIVAGLSAVMAFLTFDIKHALVAAVAVVFALTSTPGRQYEN